MTVLHLSATTPATPPGRAAAAVALDPALLAAPVLIVEDEAMIAWMVESVLEELGFTCIAIAPSGEAAIEEARRLPPRLVVSDINLGPCRMDGVAAATEILTVASPAVVFVTGYANDDARGRIVGAVPGAVVVAKPVGATDLMNAIVTATARHH